MADHLDKPIVIGPRQTVLGGTPWTIPNLGVSIDRMMASYQHYINRTTKTEGALAIKDFRQAGKEMIAGCACLYDSMAHDLPMAAPAIDQGFRSVVNTSLKGWEPFSGRWMTFLQFCQHFSVRAHHLSADTTATVIEKRCALMQLLYEMYHFGEELLELAETIPTEPDKGLIV